MFKVRLSLFLSCWLIAYLVQAQLPFSLEPALATSNQWVQSTGEITAHLEVHNESPEAIVLIWERISNDIPADWESYICSNITCSPPEVNQGIFSLDIGQSTNLDSHFLPHEQEGQGEVQLLLYLREDSSQNLVATYQANHGLVNTTHEITQKTLVFPNPVAGNYVTLISKKGYDHLVISDILGQQMAVEQSVLSNQQIYIGHLPSGLYLLYTFGHEGQNEDTILFQKL